MTAPLTIYLVVTPGVLLLDYAGPAEALRMVRARELFADKPNMTQEQLAEACGFGSAREFRRVWGRWALPHS